MVEKTYRSITGKRYLQRNLVRGVNNAQINGLIPENPSILPERIRQV
jgi:hypothetical protein